MKLKKDIINKIIIIGIFVIALIVRIIYISKIEYFENQHDVEPNGNGLSYISWIYNEHKLPDSNSGQFYQPPFHQIMAAIFLTFVSIFIKNNIMLAESLQFLTTIYSMLIIFFSYKIFKELKFKFKYMCLGLIFMAFQPYFIILSGSLNNDVLCLLLMIVAMYLLIKWYKSASLKNTTLLAIITGLSVMTKTTGALIALPISYIFILKVYRDYRKNKDKDKKNLILKKYFWLFAYFGCLSLPIGLWYNFRNLELFGQPIIYIMDTNNADLFVGNYTLIERFLSISLSELSMMYCDPWTNFNIPIYLLKCSLYGEYSFLENLILYSISLVANFGLFLLFISSIIYIFNINKKSKRFIEWKTSYFLLLLFNLIFYIKTNIDLPYGCTMDFRYMLITLLSFCILLLVFNQEIERKTKKNLLYIISLILVIGLSISSNILILFS